MQKSNLAHSNMPFLADSSVLRKIQKIAVNLQLK